MTEKRGYATISYKGNEVVCYGTLEETSNFSVICDDEYDDYIWCDAHPVTGEPFKTWQEVVESLWDKFNSEIIEISAV